MKRFFVKKRDKFQVESLSLKNDLRDSLKEDGIEEISLYNVYDIFNTTEEENEILKSSILSEVVTDEVFEKVDLEGKKYISIELQPGQYDQRADSAKQCLMLFSKNDKAEIKCATLIVFHGEVKNIEKIKEYLINPIEKREKDFSKYELEEELKIEPVEKINGFICKNSSELEKLLKELELAMDLENLKYIQEYFKNTEKRDPTITEIRVFDTYWSDHCRHTTFETYLRNIEIKSEKFHEELQNSFEKYLKIKEKLGDKKEITLMNLATCVGKYFKKIGKLEDLEISDEINACSIEIDVDVNGKIEKWLLMFKNETHNHPTEIEPYGGASTCLGGAIRDPLSGRAYVYQAMRITGAGDITEKIEDTLEKKLPQKKISKEAALGYSSYGNQIGLSTTFVKEIFDEGYKAKRMEVGVVIGAAKKENVRREKPIPGDVIILLGGRTGRDGIGGATGSSKEHTEESIVKCAAEVQKGNAVIERKIQRLFRNPAVTKLIKKSNDFGAGGVSVAIGELAEGIEVNLDKIKTKYSGLNGTDLAISESQERMAVVVDKKDVERFLKYSEEENLEATVVAEVTDNKRLILKYKGENIVDISKEFLDSNGVMGIQDVQIKDSHELNPFEVKKELTKENILNTLKDLNVCSQRGMVEMFDSSIGRSTVLMPYGGKYQLTEIEAGVQKLPVDGITDSCSILSYGYNPQIFRYSPYLGAQYAVIESLAKIVATGGDYKKVRLTFQEYFEKLGNNSEKWGKVLGALLGALEAQLHFDTPAIGGKDSMSGTYNNLNVPPTLISFAITTEKMKNIISPEFKEGGNKIYLVKSSRLEKNIPNYQEIKSNFEKIREEIIKGNILSALTIKFGGIVEAIFKMSFGNKIGALVKTDENLFSIAPGSFIVETKENLDFGILLGETTKESKVSINEVEVGISEAVKSWESTLEKIYPYTGENKGEITEKTCEKKVVKKAKYLVEKPKVLIVVFPGSNCEYDSKKAFEKAGAEVEIFVFNNLNNEKIEESIEKISEKIRTSQIFMIPGGFSAGDEPDGSGKFIANILQSEKIKEAIEKLLERDGLILGICNGFQALIKSGLLPYGKIGAVSKNSPTLFRNNINRHISRVVNTKIVSTNSPWLTSFEVGEIHSIPVSHGEGKIVIDEKEARELFENGQIITQYCDIDGNVTMNEKVNLNGSYYNIEGMISKCGRILGKMGHSERYEVGLLKNIFGNKEQDIFKNGVEYFKK